MVGRFTRMHCYGAALASVCWLSCSGEIGQVEPGLLSLQLQSAAAVRLTELEYTVSHEKGYVRSGPVAIGDKQTFSFKVDTLPPALGYEVTAFARGQLLSSNESTECTGHAMFEIKTAQATAVSMILQCDGAAPTGSATTTPQGTKSNNSCPSISAIAASPASAPVGQDILLSADVPEDKDGPLPVAVHWTADSGKFSSETAKQTSFTCGRIGLVSVQLAVSDGDQACDAKPVSVDVTCTESDCKDLTHCPNSQMPKAGTNAAAGGAGGASARAGQGGSSVAVAGSGGTSAGHGAVFPQQSGQNNQPVAGRGPVIVIKNASPTGGSGSKDTQTEPPPSNNQGNNQNPPRRRDHEIAGSAAGGTGGAGVGAENPPRTRDEPRAGEMSIPPVGGAGSVAPAPGGTGGGSTTTVGGAAGMTSDPPPVVQGAAGVTGTAGAPPVITSGDAGTTEVPPPPPPPPAPAADGGTGGAGGAAGSGEEPGAGTSNNDEPMQP